MSNRAHSTDFIRFFSSAQLLRAGESLYTPPRIEAIDQARSTHGAASQTLHPNLNTPVLALLVVPLTFAGPARGYAIWTALSLVAGLCACALVWRGLRPPGQGASGLLWLWLAFLVYFPTYASFVLGQVTAGLFLLLAGAWLAARNGRDRLAGVLLGAAVSVKLFAALLLVCFVLQGRWRVAAWSIGAGLCAALATLPFAGLAAWREYFGVIRTVTWFGNSWNASYASFITRILGGTENAPLVDAPALGRAIVALCSAVTLLWMARLTRLASVEAKGEALMAQAAGFDLGYGLTLAVMLLVSPLGWMYYFPVLLLPGYAVWLLTRGGRMRLLRLGLLAAWGLSAVPSTMVQAMDANEPIGWFTSNSRYFYALVVFAAVLGAAAARAPGPRAARVALTADPAPGARATG
ncbi:MAG TPA: glycosyltransferase family 87 protein [Vicinamibacterales bacterium]|nr:glycosyltransferase family 87 protein [Vicinamibacterales bacterium]